MAENAPPAANLDSLIARLVAGDSAALARCLTLVEGGAHAVAVRRRISPLAGRASVIGFTGAPGVGKSTLVDAYIAALRAVGLSVAVAAVDPSSPLSGGAVLGDRVRMHRHTGDPGVFIRSVAARGHLGGVSESIHWTIDAMDAAGRDVVIVETVGIGQSEVEIAGIADVCVVVEAPGLGDDVQAIKAGLLEIADIFVVNKADTPFADLAARRLEAMLKLRDRTRQDIPVILTAASRGVGVEQLRAAIDRCVETDPAEKARRRARRMRRLIAQTAARLVRDRILRSPDVALDALADAVAAGEIDSDAAARQAIGKIV